MKDEEKSKNEESSPPAATPLENLVWDLFVDFASPACMIILSVGHEIGAPLRFAYQDAVAGPSIRVVERPLRHCEGRQRTLEWEVHDVKSRVPCLRLVDATSDSSTTPVAMFEPSAIVAAMLQIWGGGKLRLSRSAEPLQKVMVCLQHSF